MNVVAINIVTNCCFNFPNSAGPELVPACSLCMLNKISATSKTNDDEVVDGTEDDNKCNDDEAVVEEEEEEEEEDTALCLVDSVCFTDTLSPLSSLN